MRARKVIISGGGTGGHLYPALAIGQKLREKAPGLKLTFVGSRRNLEKELMERHGAHFVALRIEGIKGRGWKSLRAVVLLPLAFFKSLALLLRLRPDLVVGVGGYSSGPIVLLASLLRIPTLILEQNVTPGFTNRTLARWVKRAVVAFESSVAHFKGKGVFLGNPVREEFLTLRPKTRTPELTVLVFGGSQGSRFLNQMITGALPHLAPRRESLKIFHQTGPADFEWVTERYVQSGFTDAVISPFFFDMAGYFEKTDLVVCRAGATSIAELIAAQKAALLVPFARASEDHQTKNAQELERVGGAERIPEADLSPDGLAARILFYLDHRERITEMEKNLAVLKTDRPADRIADLCFELMRTKEQEA